MKVVVEKVEVLREAKPRGKICRVEALIAFIPENDEEKEFRLKGVHSDHAAAYSKLADGKGGIGYTLTLWPARRK